MPEIQPIHVLITLVTFGVTVIGFLWKMVSAITKIQMRVDLMWSKFGKDIGLKDA